jgi:hypothetical protein
MEVLLVIGLIVFIILFIREQWIKTKRTLHNAKRSILEVRDIDDIETEEETKRAIHSMLGIKEPKKSGGGFLKSLVYIAIAGVIIYFLVAGN